MSTTSPIGHNTPTFRRFMAETRSDHAISPGKRCQYIPSDEGRSVVLDSIVSLAMEMLSATDACRIDTRRFAPCHCLSTPPALSHFVIIVAISNTCRTLR